MLDLIIIGGGMSGISVGHFFRDKKILLLEKGKQLLSEASGKNAGFIVSGFGEHFNRTAARWGIERACEIQNIHLENHRRIREIANRLDCDYIPSGSLSIGLSDREKEDLHQSYELMKQQGYRVEWLEKAKTGLSEIHAVLVHHSDASIDPVKFWNGAAQGLPAQIDCEVQKVDRRNGIFSVFTNRGTFQAENVIYCLNAFSAKLLPELKGRYISLRGQIVEFPLKQNAPTFCPVIAQYGDIYWRFAHGKLIFGGLEDTEPADEIGIAEKNSIPILENQKNWIRDHFQENLVSLALEEASARSSTMAFTVDGFPFVGPLPQPNAFVLAGLCGLGHGYAMECASWLYELIANENNKIPSYISSDRINTLPVYSGGEWRTLYEAWNH
jgi:glycine/D-amino acid oxidase-like deaminating enzyme